jgi:conjugal transfer/entry exclusion protein
MASIARALNWQDTVVAHMASATAALNCHKAEQEELLGQLHALHAKHKPI